MLIENTCLVKVYNSDVVGGHFTIPKGVTTIGNGVFSGCTGWRGSRYACKILVAE